MSSPLRMKIGCGRTAISISASPGGPPPSPGRPLPRNRSTWPSRGPGGQRELLLAAIDRIEKVELETIVDVLPAHAQIGAAAAPEDLRQNVVGAGKICKSSFVRIGMRRAAFREVAIIALLRPLGPRCIDLAAIETRTLVGIAEETVSRRNILEFLFSLLVAGIEIRMQLLRQAAIRLLDIGLGSIWLHAQSLVGIGSQSVLLKVARV